MQIFTLSHLNYAYEKELVLKDISLSYDSADFLAIAGPNGGGKSTLVKLILGLLPCKGLRLNIARELIGYVPQSTAINENFSLSVLELVLMGLISRKIFGFYSREDRAKALAALELVGIKELAHKSLSELSGGQRQRAFIARALASPCKLLVLDEPTASLDTQNALGIFRLLSEFHAKGIGVIIICHDTSLVLAYASKIAYLNKELVLHENSAKNREFIEHLEAKHKHFCEVEMSAGACLCEDT